MSRFVTKCLAVMLLLAMSLSTTPTALWAQAPSENSRPSSDVLLDAVPQAVERKTTRPLDAPNPFEYRRLRQREQLLAQGRTAEAAALAKTGKDRILVILVEFAGTDTATWSPGDTWDPIGDPTEVDFESDGDCSNVITATRTFAYAGPLHNQTPRPASVDDRAYNSMWTEDFSRQHYQDMLFGDGVYIQYTLANGQPTTIDLRGYSMKDFFEEQSKGLYSIDGDVIGWVQVPHSSAWYGADECPGARSSGYSRMADGFFPDGGDPRSLVRDAIDACVAAYPRFDWSSYDQDGDGILDHVMLVHAGLGEEDSPTLLASSGVGEMAVWSHSWTVYPYHPIGSTGLFIGPYTMQAENGTVGLFVHEYCHNIGAIDLYAYNGGETSAGFWSVMADDWAGGWPDSTVPPGLDPWHKYLLGWIDPVVLNTKSPSTEIVLGQASLPPAGTEDAVIVNLPPQVEQPVPPASGDSMWWSGKESYLDSQLTLSAPLDLTGTTTVTLQFKTFYDIEEGWDFGFVQVSTDGGTTWTSLPGTSTTNEHDPDCYFIDEMPGYTGYSEEWLAETVDLSAFAGQHDVAIRFRYETDPASLGMGWYLDDIQVVADGETIVSDGAESIDAAWIVDGWTRTDGFAIYPHYYMAEWRNASGFDAGLVSGRYSIQDFGMLLWYRNFKYSNNEVFDYLADGPALGPKGALLVVDAHFEPWRSTTSEYENEAANIDARLQMRDAAFGLRDTHPFHVISRFRNDNPDELFPSRHAVATFHDVLGWYPGLEKAVRGPGDPRIQWFTKGWDASAVIPARGWYGVAPSEYPDGEPLRFGGEPDTEGRSAWYSYPAGIGYGGGTGNPGEKGYGVHMEVEQEAPDLSWGKVVIWNNPDPVMASFTVDKHEAAPGDILSYVLQLKDASSLPAVATIDIPIPEGTTFVEGSLSGGQYIRDGSGAGLEEHGHVAWVGWSGAKALHAPDAHITYRVKLDLGTTGAVTSKALLTIAGETRELVAETALPWVSVNLSAPSVVHPRAPLRYVITVRNESSVTTLAGVEVGATWIGGAYLPAPSRSSWVIPTLAPGGVWTKDFALYTFSTATGQIVATVKASHPWIKDASIQASTSVVR